MPNLRLCLSCQISGFAFHAKSQAFSFMPNLRLCLSCHISGYVFHAKSQALKMWWEVYFDINDSIFIEDLKSWQLSHVKITIILIMFISCLLFDNMEDLKRWGFVSHAKSQALPFMLNLKLFLSCQISGFAFHAKSQAMSFMPNLRLCLSCQISGFVI
jgi:hypothetical protein